MRAIILGIAFSLPNVLSGQACGVERWPVKIWTDRDSALVDTVPIRISVAELTRIPRPDVRPWPNSNRVGVERNTYVVRARLAEIRPQSSDSDIHLILHDPDVLHAFMIAEIPDSTCVVNDPRKGSLYAQAKRVMYTVPRNGLVEVTGIAFFDYDHNQRGYVPNGIELHPVLRLTVLDSLTKQPIGLLSTPVANDSVWVNTSSRVYHCPGTQYFGRTARGYFTTEPKAQKAGVRPAGGQRCRRE